jgi:hypothetical protein
MRAERSGLLIRGGVRYFVCKGLNMKRISAATLGLLSILGLARAGAPPAQNPPAAAAPPASAPARQQIVIPAGFQLVTANGRNALVEAADQEWVTAALNKMPALTKPATLPTNMLQRISTQREPIIRQMMADLAITDPVPLANAYDTQLTPQIRTLDNFKPPMFYIVATIDRLGEVMKGGWTYPHFYYNRAADAVSFNPTGLLNTDGPMDDVIYPVVYDKKDTPEKRGSSVAERITEAEKLISFAVEQQARNTVPTVFANIVNSLAIEPLALKPDQTWFGVGIASILSAKYTAPIYDVKREQLAQSILMDNPANPLKMTAIDLLHPIDLNTMRQELLPQYFDTLRRKSARAVQNLVDRGGGDGAIAKALTAVRTQKPADGAALVKALQDATGVDVTALLGR